MESAAHAPVKIFLAGMDERSTARMSAIFKFVYKGRCVVTCKADAMLGILDLDGGPDVWNAFRRQYPTLPAIILSDSPVTLEDAIHVAKPARLDVLWDAIVSRMTGLPVRVETVADGAFTAVTPTSARTARASGTGSAADAMDSRLETAGAGAKTIRRGGAKSEASLCYNPDDYLLGRLLSALKDSTNTQYAIHVLCGEERRLVLFPGSGKAYTNLTDSQLRNFSVVTLSGKFTIAVNRIRVDDKNGLSSTELAGLHSRSIEHLVWDLALRTARGRVPEGTDLSRPLYLRYWPNFPRLPHTPHGMRIASLWVDNPRTLNGIAASLGIERADVYSFYSAAAAIGLAGRAKRQSDNLIAPREVSKEAAYKRGLLASILRRIGKLGTAHDRSA